MLKRSQAAACSMGRERVKAPVKINSENVYTEREKKVYRLAAENNDECARKVV